MKPLTIVRLGVLGAFSAGVVGVACGGVGGQILFGGAGGGGVEAASSSSGSANNGGSGPGPASSSSGQGGAASSSSVASSSGSSVTSSSSSSSAVSSSSSSSSSSGSTLPPVTCDDGVNTTCQAGEVCCYNEMPGVADSCAPPGQCGANYVELSCSGPDDCPGQVCCAQGMYDMQEFVYTGISCKAACPYTDPTTEFPVCSGPGDTSCGTGRMCVQSALLPPTYYICN